jgi:hypothetical protein
MTREPVGFSLHASLNPTPPVPARHQVLVASTTPDRRRSHNPFGIELMGRRGKSVRRQRFLPAQKAFAFARKLQGTPGCTVSVC